MMRVFFTGQHLRPVLRYGYSSRRHISAATTAESATVKVQQHPAPHSGTIRVLLLDRPEARNALSRKLVSELTRHVDEIQAEGGAGKTRALIIASNIDQAFCSGADLKERKTFTEEE
jgi:methylglutaconyl-CoA hydratase